MDSVDFLDDASTKLGAQRLANRLVAFWRARGYRGIAAGVVETKPPRDLMVYNPTTGRSQSDRRPIYTVVSNIGSHGYPPLRPA